MSFNVVSPIFIANKYIWSEMKKMDPTLSNAYGDITPFFPINDAATGTSQWGNKPYFIYNRAFRLNSGFYEIKKDTFIYSLRANVDETFTWTYALQKIIDRQDDAAADVNEWNASNDNAGVVFHSFRLYQGSPADPRDSSVSPFIVSNFFVNVDYHLI